MGTGSPYYYLLLVLLILGGGYFAATELAFASVSKMRLKNHADNGDVRARKAMYIVNHFDKALTTLLIGNNLMHIGCASLATLIATSLWGKQSLTSSTIGITIIVFLISEMLPKSFAKSHSESFVLSVAPSLRFFMRIFTPVSILFTGISRLASKLFIRKKEPTVTEDELYDIIENIKEEGTLEPNKSKLIHSALEFNDITVQDVLTSRVDMVALDVDSTPEETLELIRTHKYSRLPVYEEHVDNIIGILQIRKYLKGYLKEKNETQLRPLLDEPHFIHKSIKIDNLLEEMSAGKLHMSVVTDDYGGTMGIITVEDILEELVGEIWDEDDDVSEALASLGDGLYEMSGAIRVQDAFEMMDYDEFDRDEIGHKTMGAWAYEQFDHMPKEGDTFYYRDLIISVKTLGRQRIRQLTVQISQPAPDRTQD